MKKFVAAFVLIFSLTQPVLAQDQDLQAGQEAQQPAQGTDPAADQTPEQAAELAAQQAEDAALQPADETPEDQKDLAQQVEDARLELSKAIKEQQALAAESPAGSAQDEHSQQVFSANRLVQSARLRELNIRFHELSQQLMAQQAAEAAAAGK